MAHVLCFLIAHKLLTPRRFGTCSLRPCLCSVNLDPHELRSGALRLQLDNHPVSTVMMAFTGEAAEAWGALPFSIAKCEDNENVAKLVVERLEGPLPAKEIIRLVNVLAMLLVCMMDLCSFWNRDCSAFKKILSGSWY